MTFQNFDFINQNYEQSFQNFKKTHSLVEKKTPRQSTDEGSLKTKAIEEISQGKHVILDANKSIRFTGTLKFVDETGKFGFFIKEDRSEIFFHFSEMEKAKISIKTLNEEKNLKFSFSEVKYIGKNKVSKKAVEIKLV